MNIPLNSTRRRMAQTAAMALLLQAPAVLMAQNPVPSPPAKTVEERAPAPVSPDVEPPEPPDSPDFRHVQDEVRRAQAEARRAMKEVTRQLSGLRIGFSAPDARRIVVIPSDSTSEESLGQSREDLSVMATILSRTINPDRGRRPDLLMELQDYRFGTGRDLEAIQIDGYGAVFFLGVDFPLVATTAPAAPTDEPKTARDSTWEKTRRELLGGADEELVVEEVESPAGRAFDPDRVHQLEQRLKEAMRHGANLRALGKEDWVIVQVTGPGSERRPHATVVSGTPVVVHPVEVGGRRGGGTSQMILRVRKSAAEKLAAGQMKLEEFVREVKVSRRLEKPGSGKK